MDIKTAYGMIGYNADKVINHIKGFKLSDRENEINSVLNEIKKAAKKKLAANHPDVGGDKNKFLEIQEALKFIETETEHYVMKLKEKLAILEVEKEKRAINIIIVEK
jgi:hypothetical protein